MLATVFFRKLIDNSDISPQHLVSITMPKFGMLITFPVSELASTGSIAVHVRACVSSSSCIVAMRLGYY